VLTAGGRLPFSAEQIHGMVTSPVLQAAELVADLHQGWNAYSDAALAAQGEASGAAAAFFARFVLPRTGDLAERLASPGAQMLDVGTGVGALALGFAEVFPQLHVTGIDVMGRVVELARANVSASPVAGRIRLRQQDVAELTDQSCYDLAWMPAPFVPEPAFSTGITRIVDALRPGGVLMIGHGKFDGTELDSAISRFKTITYGGSAVDASSAMHLLDRHGLVSVQSVPTPPGAPAITIGQKSLSGV
jgi:predicted O-methyltransferase YrrM